MNAAQAWLNLAAPLVAREINRTFDEDRYTRGTHALLLGMPVETRCELVPNWTEIYKVWMGEDYYRSWHLLRVMPADWTPAVVVEDMLFWSIDAGDLNTLAAMTALAQPRVLGVDLARRLLAHVEGLLDSWAPEDDDRYLERST